MADNLDIAGAGDRKRVNVNQAHELRYWTDHWGLTEEQLRDAVAKAGPMVEDVARHLGKPRPAGSL